MLNITSETKAQTVVIYVEGRVDSTNSAQFETAVTGLDTAEGLILDLKNLEYVSSAGLRVFLRLRKKHKELTLRNASTEVYEILDMTGFTEMMKVTRAYRRISVDGAEVIGQGANGKVYRIDRDTVVKVYLNPDSLDEIEHEREVAKKALLLGIPTAISYDVVEVDDHYASMFEMLNAKSISKRLAADPDSVDENAELFVNLLKLIHSTEVPAGELPDQLLVTKGWVKFLENELPKETYAKVNALVDAIPHDDHMIHGDYHTKNVIIQNGETLLIDMDTLAVGHPVLEMASVYNAFRGFYLQSTECCKDFLGVDYAVIERFYKKAMQLYYGTEDEAVLEHEMQKAKLIGMVRLLRRSIRRKLDPQLIELYRSELIATAQKVDSLL